MDIAKKLSRTASGCAFSRAGRVFALAAVCAVAYSANAEVCYYLPDGSGAWADSSRWKNGKVPAENDTAEISDGTACVTDADSEVVARVGAITLQSRTAVIEFNVVNDFHVPNRIIGKGKIVKNGKGKLYLDAPYENFYHTTEGIEVNDGELYLVERPAEEIPGGQIDKKHFVYGPLVVNSPGKLFLRPTGFSETCGISGDGVITNTSSTVWQLYFNTNETVKAGTAYSFRGILSPNIDPTFIGVERQDFLSDNPYGHSVRCAQGTIGVAKFGNQGEAGSLGTSRLGVQANATDVPFRFEYLGTGEKTTKNFRVFGVNPGFVIDGGAYGGLEIAGDMHLTYGINKSQTLILDGSNTTPCRLSGNILESRDNSDFKNHAKASSAIVKRGSGTWRLAPTLNFQGVVAVEGGVLEAEKIEEKGTYCSLGDSTIPLEPISGMSREDLQEVPYAVLLGNGEFNPLSIGTLSYIGGNGVVCVTRNIALNGAGALCNNTSQAFEWNGISSHGTGTHALYLDGDGTANYALSVTNGTGEIAVIKKGAGKWTLDGNIDVSHLESRNGVLDVRLRRDWKYYRFNIKKVWGSEQGYSNMILNYIAFLDANKNCRSSGLVYNKKANGKIENLSYGEVAYCSDTYVEGNGGVRILSNAFVDDTTHWDCHQVDEENKAINIDPNTESTWVRIFFRLLPGTPVASFDLRTAVRSTGTTGNGNKNSWGVENRQPKAWSLEGSMDGVEWELLSENEDYVDKVVTSGVSYHYTASANLWMSTKKNVSTGYEVKKVEITAGVKMSSVDSVAVSGGGTLLVDTTLGTSRLCVDFASASGVIDGISFNEEGVIEIKNYESGNTRMEIGITFNNCSGLANLANWTIMENGRITTKKKLVAASNGRLYVVSGGMTVIVR